MNLYLDIETIPDQRPGALERAEANIKPPSSYKKPESIERYRKDNAEAQLRRTALQGIAGEVCSIAWAFDDGPIKAATRDRTLSEASILQTFFANVADEMDGRGQYPRITWVGHNVIEFDLRFLKQRSLICNVPPAVFIPADARHGKTVFDTMKEWAGWKGYVKLDALCDAFGIPGKSDVDGSMVGDLWDAGEYEKIRQYNIDDVQLVRNVYRRMTWQ